MVLDLFEPIHTILGKSYWMDSHLMKKNMTGWYIDHNCAIPLVLLLVD